MSVHEYGLKFTQLSRNAAKMVKDMKSRMACLLLAWVVLQAKKVGYNVDRRNGHIKANGLCETSLRGEDEV